MYILFEFASLRIAKNLIKVSRLSESLAIFEEKDKFNTPAPQLMELVLALNACNLIQTMKEDFISREIDPTDGEDIVEDYVIENLRLQSAIPVRDGAERMDRCLEILKIAEMLQAHWLREEEGKGPGPRYHCVKDVLRRLGGEKNLILHDRLFEFVYLQHDHFIRYFKTLLEPMGSDEKAQPPSSQSPAPPPSFNLPTLEELGREPPLNLEPLVSEEETPPKASEPSNPPSDLPPLEELGREPPLNLKPAIPEEETPPQVPEPLAPLPDSPPLEELSQEPPLNLEPVVLDAETPPQVPEPSAPTPDSPPVEEIGQELSLNLEPVGPDEETPLPGPEFAPPPAADSPRVVPYLNAWASLDATTPSPGLPAMDDLGQEPSTPLEN
jgi:hypothetical protein